MNPFSISLSRAFHMVIELQLTGNKSDNFSLLKKMIDLMIIKTLN